MAKATKLVENLPAVIEKDEREKVAMTILKKSDLKIIEDIKAKIVTFKKYESLTIEDENDSEGYETVRKAVAEMRTTRTGAEKQRKDMTKPYRDTVTFINDFFDVADDIKLIEQPLKKRLDEIDEIEESRKRKKKEEEEQKINDRVNELLKYMAWDGGYYSLASVPELNITEMSIGVVDVRSMSDDLFKQFLQQVIDKSALINIEKEKAQKIADELAAEAKKKDDEEKAEFARKQQEFQKQQDEFNKKQAELQQKEDELKQKELEEIDRKNKEAKDKRDAVIKERLAELNVGLNFRDDQEDYFYLDIKLTRSFLVDASESEWAEFKEKQFNQAIAKEHGRLEKIKKEAEDKIAKEAIEQENKRKADEQKRKDEELAAASEKVQYEHCVGQLKLILVPELKSPKYKKLSDTIRDFINGL